MGESHLICPYCGGKAVLVPSNVVYGGSMRTHYGVVESLWVCENYPKCDAYVGCHKGTTQPLGRLADKQLRYLKKQTHTQFDPIWRSGVMSRRKAYKWLSQQLHIAEKECHIGKFDPALCRKAIKVCRQRDDPQLQAYRLEHFGYAQTPPAFTRGYVNARKLK